MTTMLLPQSSYTSFDLFHFTCQRQCKTCKFKFFKSVCLTHTSPPLSDECSTGIVTHYFNPHCDVCYRSVLLVQQAENPMQVLDQVLEHMEPAKDSDEERLGQPLPCPPTRDYDSYDYVYCKACHEPVLLFHAEESLEQRNVDELVQTKGCEVCSKVTWGNVLAKTYQVLPSCGLCGKVLKPEDKLKRYCCKVSQFHFDCTTTECTCPTCGSECCIRFTLPRKDLNM